MGTRIILKPLPIFKDFSPSKKGWFKAFFRNFRKSGPISKGFLPQNGWFYNFFAIFAKWDPLLRIFLSKMGPMSKDFCWKSNPFGRHIPVCLNMWVPPGGKKFLLCHEKRTITRTHIPAYFICLFYRLVCSMPMAFAYLMFVLRVT